jgi:hypothetical protein
MLEGADPIMKAFLMHRDQDFNLQQELPRNERAVTQDLELNTLFNAMARGDNHGRKSGRQIDFSAQHRFGRIDDAMRYVCAG